MMIFNTATSYFSQNFISLFWGLLNNETHLIRVRYWQTRVMAVLQAWSCIGKDLKLYKKNTSHKFLSTALTGAWKFSLNLPIQMKWTRSELFSSAQFSFRAGQEILRCPSIFLPEPGSASKKCPPKFNYLKREK
jgi:hypothetical protein